MPAGRKLPPGPGASDPMGVEYLLHMLSSAMPRDAVLVEEAAACSKEKQSKDDKKQQQDQDKAKNAAARQGSIDVKAAYLARLKEIIDLNTIAASGLKVVFDPFWGAGRGYLTHHAVIDNGKIANY